MADFCGRCGVQTVLYGLCANCRAHQHTLERAAKEQAEAARDAAAAAQLQADLAEASAQQDARERHLEQQYRGAGGSLAEALDVLLTAQRLEGSGDANGALRTIKEATLLCVRARVAGDGATQLRSVKLLHEIRAVSDRLEAAFPDELARLREAENIAAQRAMEEFERTVDALVADHRRGSVGGPESPREKEFARRRDEAYRMAEALQLRFAAADVAISRRGIDAVGRLTPAFADRVRRFGAQQARAQFLGPLIGLLVCASPVILIVVLVRVMAPEEGAAAPTTVTRITKSACNVRRGADTASTVLRVVPASYALDVDGPARSGWYELSEGGFIHTSCLESRR